MAVAQTAISWTDSTWSPIRGCSRVSTGCEHCYAESLAGRFSGAGQSYDGLVRKTSQGFRWTGEVKLIEKDIALPLRWKKPRRIFVASMSDPNHEQVPDEWRDKILAVIALTPHHTYQWLTKRAKELYDYFSDLIHKSFHFYIPHKFLKRRCVNHVHYTFQELCC